jgi:hypothetical protein
LKPLCSYTLIGFYFNFRHNNPVNYDPHLVNQGIQFMEFFYLSLLIMKNLFILLLAFIAAGASQSRAGDKTLPDGNVQTDSKKGTAVVRKCQDIP